MPEPTAPRLFIGAMNDAVFITDNVMHDRSDGPQIVIPCGNDRALAERLVKAWNAVVDGTDLASRANRARALLDAIIGDLREEEQHPLIPALCRVVDALDGELPGKLFPKQITVGPPPDGRSVAEHLDELASGRSKAQDVEP